MDELESNVRLPHFLGLENANSSDSLKADDLELEAPVPKPAKKRKGVATSSKVNEKEAAAPCAVALKETPTIDAFIDEEEKEGLQLEKKKPTRQPSWVWEHFTRKEIKGELKAVCNYCGTRYASQSKKNGTTNMGNHLRFQCRKFPKGRDPKQKLLSFQPQRKESGETGGSNLAAVAFNEEACRVAFARMLIVDELTFRFAEGEGFRYFMSVCQPLFHVPSRITSARDCYNLYTAEKEKLKDVLSRNFHHVSFTTDCWTSIQNENYMCLTTHFIDNEWTYHKRIMSFCQIPNHKGETIGKAIESILLEWGIEKVFAITVDNATSNDTAIAYLRKKIKDWGGSVLGGELLHMRCCAHILNLIVNDGLDDMHDSIVKIRNAVKYVRASPSRMQRFKSCVEREKIQSKSLVCLDVSTRWNSTYLMLEAALKFQKAFERLHDSDGMYLMEFCHGVNVSERKKGPPEYEDWEIAEKFVKFLKVFYDATIRISGSTHTTSHMYFHDFITILNLLKKWCESKDPLFSTVARKMKKKHDKYWGVASEMNVTFGIACVLDPRYKLRFVEFVFGKLYDKITTETLILKVKNTLSRMFEEYRKLGGFTDEDSNSNRTSSLSKDSEVVNDEFSVFEDLYYEQMGMENEQDGRDEVELYLADSVEKKSDKFNILDWWKVHSPRYPILSLIVRDVLAVPMSTVASESAFSTGGRILDPYRSSLSPKMVEALICAQNWFRSTPLPEKMETQEVADEIEQEISKLSDDVVDLEL